MSAVPCVCLLYRAPLGRCAECPEAHVLWVGIALVEFPGPLRAAAVDVNSRGMHTSSASLTLPAHLHGCAALCWICATSPATPRPPNYMWCYWLCFAVSGSPFRCPYVPHPATAHAHSSRVGVILHWGGCKPLKGVHPASNSQMDASKVTADIRTLLLSSRGCRTALRHAGCVVELQARPASCSLSDRLPVNSMSCARASCCGGFGESMGVADDTPRTCRPQCWLWWFSQSLVTSRRGYRLEYIIATVSQSCSVSWGLTRALPVSDCWLSLAVASFCRDRKQRPRLLCS